MSNNIFKGLGNLPHVSAVPISTNIILSRNLSLVPQPSRVSKTIRNVSSNNLRKVQHLKLEYAAIGLGFPLSQFKRELKRRQMVWPYRNVMKIEALAPYIKTKEDKTEFNKVKNHINKLILTKGQLPAHLQQIFIKMHKKYAGNRPRNPRVDYRKKK